MINVHAYFDESGDPGTRAASSDHLILGGYLVSVSDEPVISHALTQARQELQFQPDKVFHFAKLTHDKRLRWAQIVGGLPITAFLVVLCKRGGHAQSPIHADNLYNWLVRLAIERCSWYCRQNGTLTSVTMEHPKGYQTHKMKTYIGKLQSGSTEIEWSHLQTPIRFGYKKTHEFLQIADCIASAAGYAFQPLYGLTERRYLEYVTPRLWRRGQQLVPLGLKIHPPPKRAKCPTDHAWILPL